MPALRTSSSYVPTGDQPEAIATIADGLRAGERYQTLLGATGTGKTATMAWIIEQVQKPALVIAHNKTLAAQLCNEFREFFPSNAVEYFVSYYDYYQPEAYVPQADLYIEKDSSRNDDISRLRLSATSSLFTRRDVVVVASVSCIYGLGSPEEWRERLLYLEVGSRARSRPRAAQADRLAVRPQRHDARPRPLPREGRHPRGAAGERRDGVPHLVLRRRGRADLALRPAHRRGLRRSSTTSRSGRRPSTSRRSRRSSARSPRSGTSSRSQVKQFEREGRMLEAHRIRQRTEYDLEMMQELGFCNGIENYSRILEGRPAGSHPFTLLDYFPDDFVDLRRRVASDGPADRRDVRGRPLAQADARRLRLPASVRARQPAASLRRVPAQGAADGLRLGHAGRVGAAPVGARRRAADPADVPRRPGGRAAADEEPDRRPAQRDQAARGGRRARARDDADEEDVRGPDRLPPRGGRQGALPALARSTRSSASRSFASCVSATTTSWSASTCCAKGSTCPRSRSSRFSTPTRKGSCAGAPRSCRRSGAQRGTSTGAC